MQSLWPGPNPLFQASMQASNCKAKNHSLAFQCSETFFHIKQGIATAENCKQSVGKAP